MPRDDDPIPLHDDDAPDERAMTLEEIARQEAAARKKSPPQSVRAIPKVFVAQKTGSQKITREMYLQAIGITAIYAVVASIVWGLAARMFRNDLVFVGLLVGIAAGMGALRKREIHPLLRGIIRVGHYISLLLIVRLILAKTVVIPEAIRAEKAADEHAAMQSAGENALSDFVNRDPRAATIIATDMLKSRGVNRETADPEEFKLQIAHLAAGDGALRSVSPDEYRALLTRVEYDEIRTELLKQKLDGQLRSMGLNPDFQKIYPEQNEAAMKVVTHDVDDITPAQQRAELKKLKPAALDEIDFKMRRARGEDRRPSPKLDEPDIPTVAGLMFSFSFLATLVVAVIVAFLIGLRE